MPSLPKRLEDTQCLCNDHIECKSHWYDIQEARSAALPNHALNQVCTKTPQTHTDRNLQTQPHPKPQPARPSCCSASKSATCKPANHLFDLCYTPAHSHHNTP